MEPATANIVLPTGIHIAPEDEFLWKAYNFKCLMCDRWGVALHECPPKSLNPKWRERPETRYLLCRYHHSKFHEMNWRKVESLMKTERDRKISDFLQRIKHD